MAIEKGKKVSIEYTGSLESGEVFDSTNGKGPFKFVVGENQIIPGLEKELVEMNKGEEKEVKIDSKDAYGERNSEYMKKFPKENLPPESRDKVEPGMTLVMKTPQGQQVPVKIAEVSENDITLDLNHPLAGKNLKFKVKIVDIE